MAYASWSVVFGEQPSAAKWNILGTNDSFFDALVGSGTAWTTWAPAGAGFASKSVDTGRYVQLGKTVLCDLTIDGTSNSTSFTFTLPVAAKAVSYLTGMRVADNGAFSTTPGYLLTASSSTTVSVRLNHNAAAAGWTAANAKALYGVFHYESV